MSQMQTLFRATVLVASIVTATHAQAPYPPPVQAFATLVHQSPQQSSFTLDWSMLAAADGFLNGVDPEGHRVVAGLNSITFSNFHFRDFATYDGNAFASLNAAYEASGYHHLVNANPTGASPVLTDMWLRTQGAMVTSVVVLMRGDRTMNAVNVDCNLRPLDLLHLGGHFGIPKVDASAVMVPVVPGGSAPSGPIAQTPQVHGAPVQNPPVLHQHGANDPQ